MSLAKAKLAGKDACVPRLAGKDACAPGFQFPLPTSRMTSKLIRAPVE
jgi:hypothetical protein